MYRLNREKLPCIGRGRANLILLERAFVSPITKRWPINNVRMADPGILQDPIMAMIEKERHNQTLVPNRPAT